MKWKLEFQYQAPGNSRPEDAVQDEKIVFDFVGEFHPVPAAGDTVTYQYGGKMVARKVLSRHFSYLAGWCCVNVVVTDAAPGEIAARVKE